MAANREIRTGAWYGDQPLSIEFPLEWNITTNWPITRPPLTDKQIEDALEQPVGQLPIRQLCKGKSRPLIIVDDLSRPTPAACIIPFLLQHFSDADIAPEQVRILMATGTHGPPATDSFQKKVGHEAAERCQLLVHNHNRNLRKLGSTSFGTPVIVNRDVLKSDFVIGIGGIFPSGNLGFSGGSKLALGVLGMRTITHLHASHQDVPSGRVDRLNSFRRDLDEIARMIGLHTLVSIHMDPDRLPIRLACGDHVAYFEAEMVFARKLYKAPAANDADVVICNAYPSDISLTIARNKGTSNFKGCSPTASRILITSCSEGIGFHGLFPIVGNSALTTRWVNVLRILIKSPAEFSRKAAARLFRIVRQVFSQDDRPNMVVESSKNPIWVYCPGKKASLLPSKVADMQITSSWSDIVQAVYAEQHNRSPLQVVVFPCAPMQCLEENITG
jgi:nickel-dependent lactate racemase